MKTKIWLIPVMLMALFTIAPVAYPASAEKAPAQSANSISDRELTAFVNAYVDYKRIQAEYAPALQKEKDPARKKQIEQDANSKVKRSLDANGLSPERYNRIFATVNANEGLRKKVLKQVEDERRSS
jgi:hypothetical protein